MMPPTISHTDAPFWLDRSLPAKRYPEVLLEPADLLTERRLRDPEPGSRSRDVPLVSHHDEVPELSQLHARESYQSHLSLAEPRRYWTPQGRHSIVDEPIAELELHREEALRVAEVLSAGG